MDLPSVLPRSIFEKLSAADGSVAERVVIFRDCNHVIVGAARCLPRSFTLAGGLLSVEFDRNSLLKLPLEEPELKSSLSRVLLRWRGRCSKSTDVVSAKSVLSVSGRVYCDEDTLEELPLEGGAVEVDFFAPTTCNEKKPTAPWFERLSGNVLPEPGFDLDVLAYVRPSASTAEARSAIAEGIERQLSSAQSVVEGEGAVVVHHFKVLDGVLVSVVRSRAQDEEDEEAPASVRRRAEEHRDLLLGTKRPLLRKKCAVDVSKCGLDADRGASEMQLDGGCEGRLSDVHIGIKGHGLGDKGVTVHVVTTRYLYCHYMQDRFNDSGWGCAYRSLQTLMSWCVTEGLASFPGGVLPTHREIQQALVKVGDKPPKFVGSREWIGANECCYALDNLTGVSSKILHVSSGSEMEGRSRELARHFDQQGSPVMIGGGVLAWTILGVARDSRTGKAKFLILDPHYEGADNLSVIQSKGWVAWKSSDIFKSTAFYNMCMPIRPTSV